MRSVSRLVFFVRDLSPLVFVLTHCIFDQALLAAAQSTGTEREGRAFPEEYLPNRKECFARSDVQLEGRHIFRGSLFVSSPGACCTECREHKDCVGWMFKACCDYCYLYSDLREMRPCRTSDCIGGIVKEEYRHVEDAYWYATPQGRFRGLRTTCEQEERYNSMGAVFIACADVQRRCAPPQIVEPSKSLEPVRQTCNMEYDIKIYGSDYNDGFAEKTLTAEDCCHACLRDRGCHAWAWTVDGGCFKKYRIPPKDLWVQRIGDISGTKQNWTVACGERIDGIEYNLWNPDEKNEGNATSADACCQRCRDQQSCLTWSFVDGFLCRMLFSYGTYGTQNPKAVSAYIVTDALRCNRSSAEDVATPFRIAQEQQPECASILVHGPSAERPGCMDKAEARGIFDRTIDKILGIV